jgi:chemotaxis protein CheY-P-specific phosphatase CheC
MAAISAAASLSQLLNDEITVDATECRSTSPGGAVAGFTDDAGPTLAVQMDFTAMMQGSMLMLLDSESALGLCDLFSNEEAGTSTDIADREISVLTEIGNICICAYLNTLSEILDVPLFPSPPEVVNDRLETILESVRSGLDLSDEGPLLVHTSFVQKGRGTRGRFLFIPGPGSAEALVSALKNA